MWLSRLHVDLVQQRAYDANAWQAESIVFSKAWTQKCKVKCSFPDQPVRDALDVSLHLYMKYVPAATAFRYNI